MFSFEKAGKVTKTVFIVNYSALSKSLFRKEMSTELSSELL